MDHKFILFFIVAILFWIFTIIDVFRTRFKNQNLNTIFLLLVILLPLIGSLFYFSLKSKLKKHNK